MDKNQGHEELEPAAVSKKEVAKDKLLPVQYLEIVTSEVDDTCKALSKVHGITIGKPVMAFGNARTAKLKAGEAFAMRTTEVPGGKGKVRDLLPGGHPARLWAALIDKCPKSIAARP